MNELNKRYNVIIRSVCIKLDSDLVLKDVDSDRIFRLEEEALFPLVEGDKYLLWVTNDTASLARVTIDESLILDYIRGLEERDGSYYLKSFDANIVAFANAMYSHDIELSAVDLSIDRSYNCVMQLDKTLALLGAQSEKDEFALGLSDLDCYLADWIR